MHSDGLRLTCPLARGHSCSVSLAGILFWQLSHVNKKDVCIVVTAPNSFYEDDEQDSGAPPVVTVLVVRVSKRGHEACRLISHSKHGVAATDATAVEEPIVQTNAVWGMLRCVALHLCGERLLWVSGGRENAAADPEVGNWVCQ